MRVHVVGSSGTYPTHGRPASGYVVELGGTHVWCDAGSGTFISLPVEPDLIDAVVISHQHPDHSSDLMAAFHAWTYRPDPRPPVPLYAPQAVWDRLTGFLEGEPPCFDFVPVWTGDEAEVGDLKVSFVEMDHSVPTVGSRWDGNGRTLFYTGDTGPAGEWHDLASGVDVLLSEASSQEATKNADYPHHLSAIEAGEIARRVGAETLVLTHIPPYLDPSVSVAEAESAFGRPVRLAVAGTSFEV
ncbi:MAG TPA: MBL fold metallo-hydrolase [Acidimicrobiia bacterium]|nr:MBL fold metallo-hydrolase [Acidimicrobiia bacterium]